MVQKVLGEITEGQNLLRATKEKKLGRAMIAYVLCPCIGAHKEEEEDYYEEEEEIPECSKTLKKRKEV